MAHNYTERDGMFTVREPSWHGLETAVLEEYPSRAEAQAIAHPWEPVTEPLYRQVPYLDDTFDPPLPAMRFEEVPGFVANVRSDNGDTLGVVTDTYEPVKNSVMYDIAEALEGEASGTVRLETGGSLKGGRKVWLLMRLQEPLLIPGDPNGGVVPYFAIQNAHDGSGSFRGQATMTRIVCDNTAHVADMESKKRGTEFVFSHTKNVHDRIEQAKRALAGWRVSVDEYSRHMQVLIGEPVSTDQVEYFVDKFIPRPLVGAVSDRVQANVDKSRDAFKKILDGPTCEGISRTKYGLVQASVEYLNHARRSHNAETRFQRNYLDRERIVTDAVRLAGAL